MELLLSLTRPITLSKFYSSLYYVEDLTPSSSEAVVATTSTVVVSCQDQHSGDMRYIPTSLTSCYTADDIKL